MSACNVEFVDECVDRVSLSLCMRLSLSLSFWGAKGAPIKLLFSEIGFSMASCSYI